MVLRHRNNNTMASEQPLKKKLKIEDVIEATDEPDFIHNTCDSGLPSLTDLHSSLPVPADVNEDYIRSSQAYYSEKRLPRASHDNISDSEVKESENLTLTCAKTSSTTTNSIYSYKYITNSENISFEPAPDIVTSNYPPHAINLPANIFVNSNLVDSTNSNQNRYNAVQQITNIVNTHPTEDFKNDLDEFQNFLIKQCLCGISEDILRRPFEGHEIIDNNGVRSAMLTEWSITKILHFLSNLQLLFDIYLKQNNKGYICSKIVAICNTIARNEYNLMEQIISLCDLRNRYVNYISARVVSSFFIIAKKDINEEWLQMILNFLTLDNIDYVKMNFSLEVIKRVVEWKDVEIHVLEDTNNTSIAGSSHDNSDLNVNCVTVPYSDPESFDTSGIKGFIIRSLVTRWEELIGKIQLLISHNTGIQAQTCILTFFELWENTISVKANLSVIDTKPFYAHLEIFLAMLTNNLPPIIWKQLLALFNEVLCYGSTLALQDLLPDDTCKLAHFVIRHVKDHGLLDSLPFRCNQGLTVYSFVGTIQNPSTDQFSIDKTLLQKMILLVLKSVALSIKETKSDSSDSSIGSDDSEYNQDMLVIGRSMKDVLKKLDVFLKNSLDFHPETPFSKLLIHLFSDQDDYLIESMVCTLDIIVGIPERNAVFPEILNMLNPAHSFVEFLKVVSHDSDVLLDYLVSNETCFLLYLLRFLKYIRRNWSTFLRSCGDGSISSVNEFDNAMMVLNRLSSQIERLVSSNLFPYNIDPVLKLLKLCENLYESNEFS